MALSLKSSLNESSTCDRIYLFDATGDYNVLTNPGGFGTPNPAKTDFNGYNWGFTIVDPNNITSNIGPYTTSFSGSLLFTNGLQVFPSLTGGLTAQSGQNDPNKLIQDGKYKITYFANTISTTYTVTQYFYLTCNLQCRLKKELVKLAHDYCLTSKCSKKEVDKYMMLAAYNQALCNAVRCGDVKKADKLYSLLSDLLGGNCNCGCN
jgi:hypothetical protein